MIDPLSEKFLRDARDEKRRESKHEVQPLDERQAAPDSVPDASTLPETPTGAVSFEHEGATD